MKFIDRPSPNGDIDWSPVKAVSLHGTAAGLASALPWLRNPQPANPGKRVSSNFVIAKTGEIYRLRNPEKGEKAWANGIVEQFDTSVAWLAAAVAAKVNINLLTYSIEHEATDDEMRWHKSMPDAQFNSSIELTAYLLKLAKLKANHETIVGHCQISSRQKATCPGVIFVPAYLEVLLLRHPELK